ncbi:aldehyde dehydrogenase [Anaeramoeba flamelloides]|uniref:NADP-dependent glyceraldehyde-3-phosphate dehydrogenase n=1 Tax=Anaeramoeba flamelloides TaxID=1746091 RepID=A0ABQ8XU12_9EUKA|nr:aldehyde dehydrogenase [Anaeramoeba flamelloides]
MSIARSMLQLKSHFPLYLGGKPIFNAGSCFSVKDKYTNKVATIVSSATSQQIEEAIMVASESERELRGVPLYERKNILNMIVKKLQERFEEMSQYITVETGKPIKISRVEMLRAIDTFSLASEEVQRLHGYTERYDYSSTNIGVRGRVERFPRGLVSCITPFNFPVNLIAHKIAPAIAVGCPFVVKPSPKTPMSALVLGEILAETSLLKKSWSILPCKNSLAPLFVEDPRIKMVSFTGGLDVGMAIKRSAVNSVSTSLALELGGDAATIIDDYDVDLDKLADTLLFAGMYQSGQSCISLQRLFVHENKYSQILKLLVEKAQKLAIGDPLNVNTMISPLISMDAAIKVEELVQGAIEMGAKCHCGGKRKDSLYYPTILTDVPKESRLAQEEAFGPVIYVEKFKDWKKVIERVNSSRFGLQAGIYTDNVFKIEYAFNNLEVGGVVVNAPCASRADAQPYGGIKDSGFGREGLKSAMEEMTEVKTMIMKNIDKY